MSDTKPHSPLGKLLPLALGLVVAAAFLWYLMTPTGDETPSDTASEVSPQFTEPRPEPSSTSALVPHLAPRPASEESAGSSILERSAAEAPPRPAAPETAREALDHRCPPDGCECPPSICPADETCTCRSDGSLIRTESVERGSDGSVTIRRVTLYDRDGNRLESTVDTYRNGRLTRRERTTYQNDEISQLIRERYGEDGRLLGRVEQDWADGEAMSTRRTMFGPDGEPVRSMQRELNEDGTYTMGFDNDGDGEIDRWGVGDSDRATQFFDSEGNPAGSWETAEEGDVTVRRMRDENGEVVAEFRSTSDGEVETTEVVNEDGETVRVMVRDEESGNVDSYDDDGNLVARMTRDENGDPSFEAEIEGVWFDMGNPMDGENEYFGTDESGNHYRMQFGEERGQFTLSQQDETGAWNDVATCAFDEDCPPARPPCPYTCE